MSFRPLSRRAKPDPRFDGPQPGLPDYLVAPVLRWIDPLLWREDHAEFRMAPDERLLQTLQVALRMKQPLDWRNGGTSAISSLKGQMVADREFALDVVDLLLTLVDDDHADELNTALTLGGSEWEVSSAGERRMLTQRVVGPVPEVIESVLPASERAHAHLVVAWEKLVGRHPDSSSAYRESIRAIEAAAKPVVSPDNDRATLGTIIKDLEAKPEKWAFELDHADASSVAGMCTLVWRGQIDRHGTDDPDAPLQVTQEEAAVAFHISLALVRIFAGGLLHRAS